MAETGGAKGQGEAGGTEEVRTVVEPIPFDPDHYVISSFRTLKSYALSSIDSDLYEIQFGFPGADDIGRWLPLEKILIHFEIDDITHIPLGFGDSVVAVEYDDEDTTIIESEAQQHLINWDIGIWTSAQSGGVTSRLEAYQVINDLFVGPTAYFNLNQLGIEIRSFTGGSFIKEEIDNLSVYRVVNMTLVTRVYSRRLVGPTPQITDIGVAPEVSVMGDDVIITDD